VRVTPLERWRGGPGNSVRGASARAGWRVTGSGWRVTGLPPILGGFLAVGASIGAGRAVTGSHSFAVAALIICSLVFAACLAVEWLAIALLFVSACSFAQPSALPQFHVVNVTEFLLVVLFAVAVLRRWPMPLGREARFVGGAVAVFIAAELIGVFVGLAHGATFADVSHGLAPVIYWAAFWPIAAYLDHRGGQRQLLAIAAGLTVVGVFLQLSQFLGLAGSHRFFLTTPLDHNTIAEQGTFLRIRPPGLTLMYLVGIFAIAYLLWGPARRRRVAIVLAGASLLSVALSLNRNMAIALVLGFAVAVFVVPGGSRVLAMFAIVGCLVVFAYPGIGNWSGQTGTVSAIAARFTSIDNYSGLKTDTLDDRFYENGQAIKTLKQNPLLGVGWGASYGATVTAWENGELVTRRRDFIHQQYLGIWLRTGVLGLCAFLAALWLAFRVASRETRGDQSTRWIAGGAVVSLVAIACGAWVANYFFDTSSILPIVALLAIVVTVGRRSTPTTARREAV
jgi:O-antigen ligase